MSGHLARGTGACHLQAATGEPIEDSSVYAFRGGSCLGVYLARTLAAGDGALAACGGRVLRVAPTNTLVACKTGIGAAVAPALRRLDDVSKQFLADLARDAKELSVSRAQFWKKHVAGGASGGRSLGEVAAGRNGANLPLLSQNCEQFARRRPCHKRTQMMSASDADEPGGQS